MKIRWLGHSCFCIISESDTRIITDPFAPSVGYKIPEVEADLVLVSHSHYDHNCTQWVKGNFEVISRDGEYSFKDISVKGINTFHDKAEGKKRGQNTVFNIKIEGINVCHLGDLGHMPDKSQIEEIGRVDILLIPVGGIFTIDAQEAVRVVKLLKPEIVIPMHYMTKDLSFKLDKVDRFVNKIGKKKINLSELEIAKDNIAQYKDNIIIMSY